MKTIGVIIAIIILITLIINLTLGLTLAHRMAVNSEAPKGSVPRKNYNTLWKCMLLVSAINIIALILIGALV